MSELVPGGKSAPNALTYDLPCSFAPITPLLDVTHAVPVVYEIKGKTMRIDAGVTPMRSFGDGVKLLVSLADIKAFQGAGYTFTA